MDEGNQSKRSLRNIDAGELLNIIDVREREEVSKGHIKDIINIPLSELENKK